MKTFRLSAVIKASFADSRKTLKQNWRYEGLAALVSVPIIFGIQRIAYDVLHIEDTLISNTAIIALVLYPALNIAQLCARLGAVPKAQRGNVNVVADAAGLPADSEFRSLDFTSRS